MFLGASRPAPAQAPADAPPDRPVIRSAAEIAYPPFSTTNADGDADGFSVELMREALNAIGYDVAFETGHWAEVRGRLDRGEVDALPLVARTPEREPLFDFTFPYLTMHGAIVVRKGDESIRNLEELRGKDVAVMRGDSMEEFLRREARHIRLHPADTFADALYQLSEGRHDAVVIQRLVALRLIQEHGLTNLHIVPRAVQGFHEDFCFAVREGDRDTLALLNEGLAIAVANGTRRRLHHKWFASLELPTRRRILIGGDHNYPPYEYLDENGQPAGYNVELTRAIAQELGLEIEIALGPWAEVREALAGGELDALQGMFYSRERDREFDFTPAHVVNHCVSVARKGEGAPPSSIEELKGKRIVVQSGDIMHDWALEHGLGDEVTAVESQEGALRELSEGKHDCALVARMTALYWIKERGLSNLAVGSHDFLSPEYCYAVPEGEKALLAELTEGLRLLEETGEYRRIYEKWLGVYPVAEPVTFLDALRYSARVVVPLLVVLLGVLLWTWTLRRQVGARTAALRKSEAQYRLLAEKTLDVIWTMSPNLVFTYVNPAIERLTGHVPEEWIGSRLEDHCDEANARRMMKVIEEEIAKGAGHKGVIFEAEVICKDGSTLSVEIHGQVIFDEQGLPVSLQGVTRDITERKRAEREIEALSRFPGENPNPVIRISKDGVLQYANRAAKPLCERFGARADSRIASPWHERIATIYASGEAEEMEVAAGKRHLLVTAAPIPAQGYVNLYARDITQRHHLEEQLRQSQKLEAIGQLAGGVAHDFNNILTGITGFTRFVLDETPEDSPQRRDLEQVLKLATRAETLTRQLLAFSRRQTLEPRIVNINRTIEDMTKMLRRLIGEHIELIFAPSPELWNVKADTAQIEQVLMNLAVNARDAMPDGGKLTIETGNVVLDEEYARTHESVTAGEHVMIAVSDTGIGMDAETRARIFDPFFSTKEPGKGTGLGLSMAYGIVKQHGGNIWVYSEPGKGTTFKIYLPRVTTRVEEAEAPSAGGRTPRGRETILLVEDEAPVRRVARRILEKQGYRVLAAASPSEAEELLARSGDEIALLLTDVVLPEKNGRELYEEAVKSRPGLRVVYMSGYTDSVVVNHGVLDRESFYLQKPFTPQALTQKVRSALDQ